MISADRVPDNLGLDMGKSYKYPVTKTRKKNMINCKIHICQYVSSMPATVLSIQYVLTHLMVPATP